MNAQRSVAEPETAGFAVLDDKGRLSLPRPLRSVLGLHPGSAIAYVRLNDVILLIPQDEQLAALMERAATALDAAGLTADDFLATLPASRDAIVREAYGDEFMQELERRYGPEPDDAATPQG